MKQKTAQKILKLMGWRVESLIPEEAQYVCAVAPHTSFWDFIYGYIAFRSIGIHAHFIIKKEFFVWPIGRALRRHGGLPIQRGDARTVIRESVALFQSNPNLALVVTPEGTRQYTKKWKRGYHSIAYKAGVPIYIGAIDYKKKCLGMVARFEPTGDYDSDYEQMKPYWIGLNAKFPDQYNL